jgi:hypothetical protein
VLPVPVLLPVVFPVVPPPVEVDDVGVGVGSGVGSGVDVLSVGVDGFSVVVSVGVTGVGSDVGAVSVGVVGFVGWVGVGVGVVSVGGVDVVVTKSVFAGPEPPPVTTFVLYWILLIVFTLVFPAVSVCVNVRLKVVSRLADVNVIDVRNCPPTHVVVVGFV